MEFIFTNFQIFQDLWQPCVEVEAVVVEEKEARVWVVQVAVTDWPIDWGAGAMGEVVWGKDGAGVDDVIVAWLVVSNASRRGVWRGEGRMARGVNIAGRTYGTVLIYLESGAEIVVCVEEAQEERDKRGE